MPVHGLHLDFVVGKGGEGDGIPVDEPLAPINQAVGKEFEECLTDRSLTHRVHGEPDPLPVAGAAYCLELLDNRLLVLVLPLLDKLDELRAGEVRTLLALLQEPFLDHGLCGDTGVIGAGHPESVSSAHPVEPDQNVLQRVVEGVAEVQGGGNVRRGNDD